MICCGGRSSTPEQLFHPPLNQPQLPPQSYQQILLPPPIPPPLQRRGHPNLTIDTVRRGNGVIRPAPVYPSYSPAPTGYSVQTPTTGQLSPAGWEASTSRLIQSAGGGGGNGNGRSQRVTPNHYQQQQQYQPQLPQQDQQQRRPSNFSTSSIPRPLSPSARVVQERIRESNEGKLSVGIDFGTTFSGCAFGSTRLFEGEIRQILTWPGSYEHYRKIPSCILYFQPDPNIEAEIVAWGLEAKNLQAREGMIKCEWFKLLLSPSSLSPLGPDPRLPPLPKGKDATDVIADFLRCLWGYCKKGIGESIGAVVDLDSADVLLTVPATWDAKGCALMREAAIRAGLVQSSRAGDKNWRDRLRIITEPEAAAIHASTLSSLHHLQPNQSFVVCDAGGGTVDCAVYRLLGNLSQLEIAEMCIRSGSNCGSLFVDLRFEELIRIILKDHPIHLDPPSMGAFMHAFSEVDKLTYQGTDEDDEAMFRFDVFNVEDCDDPSIGLEYGQLAIPGRVIKREVFDPIIDQVIELLHYQLSKLPQTPVDAIILVGGFAASEYLFRRVQETFQGLIPVIARPNDCDVATLRGAARYGLGINGGKKAVSSVVAPRSYCMKVKLPAEPIDFFQRPQFIMLNDAKLNVCANRMSYLVEKGAVLKKGVRLRSRFCKYSKGPSDSFFTAVLYSSDGDCIYRYTDEGETAELCRWTVDLALLPNFRRIAQTGGGYVEFDLGLELDSAEVRGVLLSDEGVECGRATFEFLGGG